VEARDKRADTLERIYRDLDGAGGWATMKIGRLSASGAADTEGWR
jgi:hypothetical protein